MVRYYESTEVFHFPWEQVVTGFWRRYPNPESGHVLTEDTLWREVRGGVLHSRRLLTKTSRVPRWGRRLAVERPVVRVLEDSELDLAARTLTTRTTNLGYTRVMRLVERVVYRPREDGISTLAERAVWVESRLPGFGPALQAFAIQRYKKNSSKMASGFKTVLNKMFPKKDSPDTKTTEPPKAKGFFDFFKPVFNKF